MKVVFFGTSSFAARVLEHLVQQKTSIVAVVTRPDKPYGRSLNVASPPVKEMAKKLGLSAPTYQPEKASTEAFAEILKSHYPDLFLVVAYGEIIKQNLLNIPKLGSINIHASLLPKYRGAAPIQRCLMDGSEKTGITIIEMALQMDAGDMLEVAEIPITQEMNFGELEQALCTLACQTISKVLDDFSKGRVKKTPQNHSQVTFAPKITAAEEEIKWERPAQEIYNLIRALSPYPGAWCRIKIGKEEKRLKIKKSIVVADRSGTPGAFLSSGKEGWVVACGNQALRLLEVQLEGKKTMSAEVFFRGLHEPVIFN